MDQVSSSQIKTNVIQFNGPSGDEKEPLRRHKFIEYTSAGVVLAHILFFASFIQLMPVEIGAPDAINAELVNEGDFFNSEAINESEEVQEKKKADEEDENPQQEAALEKPLIKNAEAEAVKEKKEEEKKKAEEKTDSRDPSQARGAQAARRAGAPNGGGAKSGGGSRATCLAYVATSLRRRLPGATKLGKGWANVSFNITPGGGVSGISVSGSSPAHAALARRIISGVRGADSCGSEFVSQRIFFD